MPRKEKPPPLSPREKDWLAKLVPGDTVERRFEGPGMLMTVSYRDHAIILCEHNVFDAATGAELNDEMGWGPQWTGSFIRPPRPDRSPKKQGPERG